MKVRATKQLYDGAQVRNIGDEFEIKDDKAFDKDSMEHVGDKSQPPVPKPGQPKPQPHQPEGELGFPRPSSPPLPPPKPPVPAPKESPKKDAK